MKKSFWSKPITWGEYTKLCGSLALIGAIIGAIEALFLYTGYPTKFKDWLRDKLRKDTDRE